MPQTIVISKTIFAPVRTNFCLVGADITQMRVHSPPVPSTGSAWGPPYAQSLAAAPAMTWVLPSPANLLHLHSCSAEPRGAGFHIPKLQPLLEARSSGGLTSKSLQVSGKEWISGFMAGPNPNLEATEPLLIGPFSEPLLCANNSQAHLLQGAQ